MTQLGRGVEVEFSAGFFLDASFDLRQCDGELARQLREQVAVDEHAGRFHIDEDRRERQLDAVEQRLQLMVLELGSKRGP